MERSGPCVTFTVTAESSPHIWTVGRSFYFYLIFFLKITNCDLLGILCDFLTGKKKFVFFCRHYARVMVSQSIRQPDAAVYSSSAEDISAIAERRVQLQRSAKNTKCSQLTHRPNYMEFDIYYRTIFKKSKKVERFKFNLVKLSSHP